MPTAPLKQASYESNAAGPKSELPYKLLFVALIALGEAVMIGGTALIVRGMVRLIGMHTLGELVWNIAVWSAWYAVGLHSRLKWVYVWPF